MTENPACDIWDVAVIGAGPAGSITAFVAAQRGLRVALIDQHKFPRDKSCGDGIGPGGARLLERLGLGSILAGQVPIDTVSITAPDGAEVSSGVPAVNGESHYGYVIARKTFDDKLFRAACRAGAADFSGYKLCDAAGSHPASLPPGTPYRQVTLRRDGREQVLRCRLLVGADGPYSAVRRMISIPAHPARCTLIAMRAYADVPDDFDRRLIFEFHREMLPGYGWIFPDGLGSVNVGVGLPVRTLQNERIDIRARLAIFIGRARERGLVIGELRGHRSHHLPTASYLPRLTYDRLALVGDSAAMINPMSGEGIIYAMTAGADLADRLPADLTSHDALQRALTGYAGWYRRRYRRHMLLNTFLSSLIGRVSVVNWVVRILQRDAELMRAVVALIFGIGNVPKRTAWRILRASWKR